MQFNLYKENVTRYIDDYYAKLIQEIDQRPESSYPILFKEELSTLNRYSHSLFKEIIFEIQDELEQSITEEQARDKLTDIKKVIEEISIQPISYQPLTVKVEDRLIIRNSSVQSTAQVPPVSVYRIPAISGGVFGAALGGIIGKTLSISALGALSGGALACTATYYYFQRKSSQTEKGNVIINKPKQEKPSVISIIEDRKAQIKREFILIINKVEEQFYRI